jgi:hypothetical protein
MPSPEEKKGERKKLHFSFLFVGGAKRERDEDGPRLNVFLLPRYRCCYALSNFLYD